MSFIYEEKQSQSPYVDVVWHTEDQSEGVYIASADGCWDMIFINSRGKTKVLLSGPSSRITPVPYAAGNKNFGVRFQLGTIFTHIPVVQMVDVTEELPMPTDDSFVLGEITWSLPTYENIDVFLAELEERGLLRSDPVVRAALEDRVIDMSDRSVQRHFKQATGLSPRRVMQILRARKAVELLQQGIPIADVAYELGYADQAHMTRMLKRYTGYTPLRNQQRGERV